MKDKTLRNIKYPKKDLGLTSLRTAIDVHPHTNYSDGTLCVAESLEEARSNGVYEKGAIEHGNPIDEDIEYLTSFLNNLEEGDQPYSSTEIYPFKYDNLREMLKDIPGSTTLSDSEPEKLEEDLEILKSLEKELESGNLTDNYLNYSLVIPHGIELDYNPSIETADKEDEVVQSYEKNIIEFLKKAESLNSGFNYVLLSSHHVNTPYQPKYVKKDELFEEMTKPKLEEVLGKYKKKEISKIESLSSKLDDLIIPELSSELMSHDEVGELENFIYNQSDLIENIAVDQEIYSNELMEVIQPEISIESPGIIAVGAHPTLIERNEELLDYFREEQDGITSLENIKEDLNERLGKELSKQDTKSFLGSEAEKSIYPSKELKKYYKPIIKASRKEGNFIFEINGKGVERQHPSVFWSDLDEFTFGSDSHRPGEQPERSKRFSNEDISGNIRFMSELWLNKLKNRNNTHSNSIAKNKESNRSKITSKENERLPNYS